MLSPPADSSRRRLRNREMHSSAVRTPAGSCSLNSRTCAAPRKSHIQHPHTRHDIVFHVSTNTTIARVTGRIAHQVVLVAVGEHDAAAVELNLIRSHQRSRTADRSTLRLELSAAKLDPQRAHRPGHPRGKLADVVVDGARDALAASKAQRRPRRRRRVQLR